MAWDADSDLSKLTAALEAHDKAATSAFCNDLIVRIYKTAEAYPFNPAKKLLSALRKRRFFDLRNAGSSSHIQKSRPTRVQTRWARVHGEVEAGLYQR